MIRCSIVHSPQSIVQTRTRDQIPLGWCYIHLRWCFLDYLWMEERKCCQITWFPMSFVFVCWHIQIQIQMQISWAINYQSPDSQCRLAGPDLCLEAASFLAWRTFLTVQDKTYILYFVFKVKKFLAWKKFPFSLENFVDHPSQDWCAGPFLQQPSHPLQGKLSSRRNHVNQGSFFLKKLKFAFA